MSTQKTKIDNIFFEEAEFNQKSIKSISSDDIHYLKKKALETKRQRYRLCLHSDVNHLTQEMIICLKGKNYFRTHKHPLNYSESYYMIEGCIDIYLFDNNGNFLEKVNLCSNSGSFYYRLSGSIFHLVIPRTEWTIYHEVATGPFDKKKSIIFADFAPDENDDKSVIDNYINQIELNC